MKHLFIFILLMSFGEYAQAQAKSEEHYRIKVVNGDTILLKDPIGSDTDTTIITTNDGRTRKVIYFDKMPSTPYNITDYITKELLKTNSSNQLPESFKASVWVQKDGTISKVKFFSSIPASLRKDIERILLAMPNWRPAERYGKKLDAEYIINYSSSD